MIPVALVLVAAVLHPAWNVLAKRATASDPAAFVWVTSALSAAFYVPVVAGLVGWGGVRLADLPLAIGLMAGTGLLHLAYSLLLQRGYRDGLFSVVYPVARGSGPLLTSVAATLLLGERVSPIGWAGIATIVAAIVVISGTGAAGAFRAVGSGTVVHSVRYGLATGATIAAYTLWDKRSVAAFAVSPILYDFGRTSFQTLLAAPAVLHSAARRMHVAAVWRSLRREAIGVALLSPAAYLLVLYALTQAPVSVVAPIRESSIVIAAFFGARAFHESGRGRRTFAAALMLAGIVALVHG